MSGLARIDAYIYAPHGHPLLADPFNPMLIAPFAFGMLLALWGNYVPVHWAPACSLFALAFYTYDHGNWNVIGPVRLPVLPDVGGDPLDQAPALGDGSATSPTASTSSPGH